MKRRDGAGRNDRLRRSDAPVSSRRSAGLKKPVTLAGLISMKASALAMSCCMSTGLVVKNLFAEDSEKEVKRLEASIGTLRLVD